MNRLVLIILLLCSFSVSSQNTTSVLHGKITDASNGHPLPYAYVFVDKTTIVTQTNHEGYYRLEKLPAGNLDIRVSYTGYTTANAKIKIQDSGDHELSVGLQAGIDLNTVVISAKADRNRNIMLKTIFNELIGDNSYRKNCRVINPEVISVKITEDGHLQATSSEPVIIENKALGYRIYQELTSFDYFNGMTYFGGSVRFENLAPANQEQWLKWNRNRTNAYYGSLKHLLVSLASGKTSENGFKIFSIRDTLVKPRIQFAETKKPSIQDPASNRTEVSAESLVSASDQTNEWSIRSKLILEIFYTRQRGHSPYKDMPYQYSEISLPQQFMMITQQGWITEPRGMTVEGHFSSDRLGLLLPADWQPE